MPKLPANPHPLAQVRNALGWTQQKLADKCGVALVTIKKIEGQGRDKRSLSRDLLGRVMWATGVDPESLSEDKPTFRGEPYTSQIGKEFLESVQTRKPFKDVEVDGWTKIFLENQLAMLTVLMDESLKKNAFRVVRWSFLEWMADTIVDFDMEKQFALRLKEPDISMSQVQLKRALLWRKKTRKPKR